VPSSVPPRGPGGPDGGAGEAHAGDERPGFARAERIAGVVGPSADVRAAGDVDPGPGIRELIVGPLAAWPPCSIAPGARRDPGASGRPRVCDAVRPRGLGCRAAG
jgi:hypothetical protein